MRTVRAARVGSALWERGDVRGGGLQTACKDYTVCGGIALCGRCAPRV